ncbi:MAG: DUF1365 family protein [Proteobacteria bacterium]|nr:DUF1365 family protein [Pseudomonadota bacterium]
MSPFIALSTRYHFHLLPPSEEIRIGIRASDIDGPLLLAGFQGQRHDLTTGALVDALSRLPLLALKVTAAIHFEAVRLWLKGARAYQHPRARQSPQLPGQGGRAAPVPPA